MYFLTLNVILMFMEGNYFVFNEELYYCEKNIPILYNVT